MNKNSIKLSVVVPVYNGEDTIEKWLQAIVDQENVNIEKDYEVVVINDGSTDSTSNIVKKFPVRLINLNENSGRIIARLEGAKAAKSNKLLFVDSRMIPDGSLISNAIKEKRLPSIAGDIGAKKNKYSSFYNTDLYLIRKKYYRKSSLPGEVGDGFLITKENFHRAAKGTGILLINKADFITSIPERTDKFTNDDTFLFEKLVFELNKNILKNPKLTTNYIQRSSFNSVRRWLFDRGIRFADYYIRPGGRYFSVFALMIFLLIVFLVLLVIEPRIILLPILIYTFVSIYLAENIKDFFIFFLTFPIICVVFASGVLKFWLNYIFKINKQ